jgi:dihydroorotate dehydrogenase electron transfer subunit
LRSDLSKLFKISIRENRKIAENHYILTAQPHETITRPAPGQFFMISVGSGMDPLLRRPFSIHRWLDGNFQIMYRVVGRGTGMLRNKMTGDILDVLGPLGNGFPPPGRNGKRPVLIAGGIGAAPILALAEEMKDPVPLCVVGARTAADLMCLDELRALGIDSEVSTDDGSAGVKGSVIDLLNNFIVSHPISTDTHQFYACGPRPMLRSLSQLALKHGIGGYMALEEVMACGIGTCQGCVVNTVNGYRRVCKEGPVFFMGEVTW